jgi:hypothetical protein
MKYGCPVFNRSIPMFDPILDKPVHGARAFAVVLNLYDENGEPDTRAVFYGLERGYYDATQRGRRWESTPRRLLAPHLEHLKQNTAT